MLRIVILFRNSAATKERKGNPQKTFSSWTRHWLFVCAALSSYFVSFMFSSWQIHNTGGALCFIHDAFKASPARRGRITSIPLNSREIGTLLSAAFLCKNSEGQLSLYTNKDGWGLFPPAWRFARSQRFETRSLRLRRDLGVKWNESCLRLITVVSYLIRDPHGGL